MAHPYPLVCDVGNIRARQRNVLDLLSYPLCGEFQQVCYRILYSDKLCTLTGQLCPCVAFHFCLGFFLLVSLRLPNYPIKVFVKTFPVFTLSLLALAHAPYLLRSSLALTILVLHSSKPISNAFNCTLQEDKNPLATPTFNLA